MHGGAENAWLPFNLICREQPAPVVTTGLSPRVNANASGSADASVSASGSANASASGRAEAIASASAKASASGSAKASGYANVAASARSRSPIRGIGRGAAWRPCDEGLRHAIQDANRALWLARLQESEARPPKLMATTPKQVSDASVPKQASAASASLAHARPTNVAPTSHVPPERPMQ